MKAFCILLLSLFFASPSTSQESRPDSSGLLMLDSYPDSCEVSIDGIPRGLTPFPALSLEPGMHVFRMTKPGYLDYLDTLHVLQLDTVRIRTRLLRPGHLVVHSDPPGAELFLNDSFRGFTPMQFAGLPPGQHRLHLEMNEYQRMTRNVLVPEGDTLVMHVPMTSRYGTFTLTVQPERAMILINGDSVGIGSLLKYKLPTGRHDFEVRDPDYPSGVHGEFFVGPSTNIHLRARMGVLNIVPTAAAFLLPGFAQIRDGSYVEGFALSVGTAVTAALYAYQLKTYLKVRSEYEDLREAYRNSPSELGALQLRFQVEQSYPEVSRRRNLMLTLGWVLGAFLTYNAFDVVLNHQFTINILDTVRPGDGPQSLGFGNDVTVTSRINF
jgi:hypothetical protein